MVIPKLTYGFNQAQLKVFSLLYKHMKNYIKSDDQEAKNQTLTKLSYLLDKIKYAAKTTAIALRKVIFLTTTNIFIIYE